MKAVRIFAGDDGESHFEDLEIPLIDLPSGGGRGSKVIVAESLTFREAAAGVLQDFHTAPRRQLLVLVGGVVEFECGDGSVCRLGPGEVLLADDTTGRGHLTRFIDAARCVFIGLPEDFDVASYRIRT